MAMHVLFQGKKLKKLKKKPSSAVTNEEEGTKLTHSIKQTVIIQNVVQVLLADYLITVWNILLFYQLKVLKKKMNLMKWLLTRAQAMLKKMNLIMFHTLLIIQQVCLQLHQNFTCGPQWYYS